MFSHYPALLLDIGTKSWLTNYGVATFFFVSQRRVPMISMSMLHSDVARIIGLLSLAIYCV